MSPPTRAGPGGVARSARAREVVAEGRRLLEEEGAARTHYAFDVRRGGDWLARVAVVDSSRGPRCRWVGRWRWVGR